MHVFVVVAIGIAAAMLHAPKSSSHACTTPRAAVGTRLELVNAENHARSWCTVVAGAQPFGSVIAVDAIVREELAMGERAIVRVNREIEAPRCTAGLQAQTCVQPKLCVLSLPTTAPLRCSI